MMAQAAHTAVYALSLQGAVLAGRIAEALEIDLYVPLFLKEHVFPGKDAMRSCIYYDSLSDVLHKTYRTYRNLVFIAPASVAVRCIAPHIHDLSIDPAVVVLDHAGAFAISLLSGPLEGSNELARVLANITGGTAVVTTTRETENVPQFDILAHELGLRIHNIDAVVAVKEALLAKRPVMVDDPHNHLRLRYSAWKDLFVFTGTKKAGALSGETPPIRITVTAGLGEPAPDHLVLHPRVLHVGVDCRRGAKPEELLELLSLVMERAGLAPHAIASLAATDIRQFEQGILQAAESLGATTKFFPVKECAALLPQTRGRGKKQEPETFVEQAATLAAGDDAIVRMPAFSLRSTSIAIVEETTAAL